MLNLGFELTTTFRTAKQRNRPTRLHPQNLHMACRAGWQRDDFASLQWCGAVESWHI
jgi:hypothetical protein